MTEPSFTITKEQAEGPMVYIYWLDKQCQWVGSTRYGLQRPTGRHEFKNMGEYTHIECRPDTSHKEAIITERKLIRELQPQYNIQGIAKRPKRKENTAVKVYDKASGAYEVYDKGALLFSSFEKYLQQRFFAQYSKRVSTQRMIKAGIITKAAAREKEQADDSYPNSF